MTFEELAAAPPRVQQWYVTVGYLDAPSCRERADDWCAAPMLAPALPAPLPPVSEPGAALLLACGLIALGILRRVRP